MALIPISRLSSPSAPRPIKNQNYRSYAVPVNAGIKAGLFNASRCQLRGESGARTGY